MGDTFRTHQLPGSAHAVPGGSKCDNHPDRPATHRRQGETDSFGCEVYDFCAECNEDYNRELREAREATEPCDWCGEEKSGLLPARDYDEGMAGPVYMVCRECRLRQNEAAQAEYEAWRNEY